MSMKVAVKSLHFGTTFSNGDLDYNVYCDKNVSVDESSCSRHLLRAQIFGDIAVNEATNEIWSAVAGAAKLKMNQMFIDSVPTGKCDLIVSEVGDSNDSANSLVIVRFNRCGPWPAIFRRSDINYNNFLTFNGSSDAFALWDNERWYKHRDDWL